MVRFLYAIVLVLVVGAAWQGWSYHQTWHYLEDESLAMSYGASPDKAKVTIIAFVNYASRPSKDTNAAVMGAVHAQPDARVIFHPVPGSQTGVRAAAIAMAAGMQGQFVPMHEELMRHEGLLPDETIRAMAEKLKIDPDRLLTDSRSPEVLKKLRHEVDAEKRLKITMSPLFLVNRKWLYGPDSVDAVFNDLTNLIIKARNAT